MYMTVDEKERWGSETVDGERWEVRRRCWGYTYEPYGAEEWEARGRFVILGLIDGLIGLNVLLAKGRVRVRRRDFQELCA